MGFNTDLCCGVGAVYTIGSITSNDTDNTICQGSEIIFTATPNDAGGNIQYQWRVNGVNQGSKTYNNTYSTSSLQDNHVVTVVLTSDCTGSNPVISNSISIDVNPLPTVNIGGELAAICQGETTTALGGSFGGGATAAVWSDGGAGGSFSNNSGSNPANTIYTASASAPASITLTLTTAGGSCGTVTATKNLMVNQNPTVNAGGALAAICQGETTTALGGSFGGGATSAVWSDGGAGGSFSNNSGSNPANTIYTASASAPASITLTLTTAGGACGTVTATKTLTINPNSTVNAGGALAGICQGGTTAALGGSFGGGATSAVWSDGGAGGSFSNNSGSNPANTTYTASTSAPASIILTLTTTGGSCGTVTATKTLTINSNPTVNAGGAISAVCQGETTTALGGSFGGGATSAIWSDGGAGGSFTSNSGSNPGNTTYTASASAPSSITLTLTTAGGSCGTVTATKTLTINPNPTVNAGGALAAICQGGTTAALGGSFGGGATSAVWSDGGAGGSFSNNSGSNPANTTYTAPSSAQASITLTLTSAGGSCETVTATKSLNINPNPTVNAGGALASICQGETTTALGGSFGGGATSAIWSDGGAGGSFSNNSGSNPANTTYTASSSAPASITLTLTTAGGPCGTVSSFKTLTVNPNPIVNSGPTITAICQGGTTAALGGSFGGGATSAVWTDGGAGGSFSNNAGSNPANTTYTASTSAPASITLTLTTAGGPCGTVSSSKTLTVNPSEIPSVSITASSTSICTTAESGSIPVTFTATPTNGGASPSYQWQNGGANVGTNSATYTANSLANGSEIWVVMTSNATCASPLTATSNAVTVTGYAPPSVPVFSPAPSEGGPINTTLLCPPNTGLVYTVAPDSNVTDYNWSLPTGWVITAGAGTNSITINNSNLNAGNYNVTVTAQNSCGESSKTLPITIETAASVYAGADASICEGSSYMLSNADASGYINENFISWSATPSGSGSFNDNTLLNPTFTPTISSGTITLTLKSTKTKGNFNCSDLSDPMTLTVNAPATAVAGTAVIACSDAAVNITAGSSATNNTGVLWTSNGTGTIANPTSLTTATYTPGTGERGPVSLTLTATGNTPCEDAVATKTLTISQAPTAVAGTDVTACSNAAVDITTGSSATNNVSILWTSNGTGTITNPTSLTAATYTPGAGETGPVTITLAATGNTACANAESSKTLTITQVPTAVAGTAVTTCSNTAVNITEGSSATNNAGILWTSNGTGTITNPTSLTTATYTSGNGETGPVTLTLTATGNTPCQDAVATKTLTISQAATAVAGTDAATCSNADPINITTGSSATNNTGILWTSNGTGTIANPSSLTTATYSPGTGETGPITLTLTATGNTPCEDAVVTKTLTISQAPTAVAGSDVATCSNADPVNITTGSSATNNAGILWTSNGTGTIANPSSLTTATYSPGTGETGPITLTLTATGNTPCEDAVVTKTLTISQAATAVAGTEVTTCSDADPVNITTGSSATNNAGILWTSNGTGTIANPSSLTTATYSPGTGETGPITLTLTATGNTPCEDAVVTKTLTISRAATAVAGTDVATCSNADPVNITSGSSATNNAGILWTSNGTGTIANPTSLTAATYTPGAGETGPVTITLAATGNTACANAESSKTLTITQVPTAVAGTAVMTCSNTAVNITEGSSATNNAGILWTSNGTGTIINPTSLTTATYTPGNGETGPVTLTLTATANTPCQDAVATKTLTINQEVLISTHPDPSQSVCVGFPFSFSVEATGTNLSYQWQLDGTDIPGATSATYSVEQASSSNDGIYKVIVRGSSPCIDVTSNEGELVVNQDITITNQPEPTNTLCEDEPFSLSVEASGNIYSLVWRKDGIPLSDGNGISGTGSATLTFSSISIEDSGSYDVVISSPEGSCSQLISPSYDVIVNKKPIDPESATASNNVICLGESTVLTLNGGGGGTDEEINWYTDDLGGTSAGTGNELTVSPTVTTTYYGRYETPAPCSLNSEWASVTITVNIASTLTLDSPSETTAQTICIESALTPVVYAIGGGAVNASITAGKFPTDVTGEFDPVKGTFTISGTPTEAGTFTYTVSTEGSCEEESLSGTIIVNPAPVIVSIGNNMEICSLSEGVDFTTGVTVSNESSIEWSVPEGMGTISNPTQLTGATYSPVSASGTVTITLTVQGLNGCSEISGTKTIIIIPQPEITAFTYTSTLTDTATEFCETDEEAKLPQIDGTNLDAGVGEFTLTSGTGLDVNSTTGEFTPNGHTPGTYVITYSYNATSNTAVCTEVSRDFTVTIGANPVATFKYDNTIYCRDTRDNTFNTAPVISFTEDGHENADSFTADKSGLILDAATGAIDLSNSSAGIYKITRTVDYTGDSEDGCKPVPAEFTITINDRPIPDFSYSSTEYCSDPAVQETIDPVMGANAVKGVFSYTATPSSAVLNINTATGEVDITSSDEGTYVITNTVDIEGDGCESVSAEFTITIDKLPSAIFSYAGISAENGFCISSLGAIIENSPDAGGAYFISGPSSAVTIDKATGKLTWTNTEGVAGDYIVKYTIPAGTVCDEVSHSETIFIDALPVGGDLNWSTGERIFLTCEVQTNDLHQTLSLVNYSGQVVEWEYRTASNLTWTTFTSQNAFLTNTDFQNFLGSSVESTVFRAKIANGACNGGVYSKTAILSVIPSDIKPSPVEVDPEVLCYGNDISLSSETGYGAEYGKFEGGDFTSAGIKNNGWDFTDPDGKEINYNANADSGTPIHWHKTQPKWKFITAEINSPYSTTEKWWNPRNDGKQNEHFAIAQSTYSSNMDTPEFNLLATDEAVLTFDQAYNLTTDASIRVVLLKNGVEYKELYKVVGPAKSGAQDHFGYGEKQVNQMSIDLGSYIGESNLRIRFEYRGERLGDIWAVDNIKVPDGPQDVLLQWFYDDDPTVDDNELEQIGQDNQNTVSFTPKKIGWNDFEVKTALLLDSNGDPCYDIQNSETIKVFVFDQYTTTVTTVAGECGSTKVQLTAVTEGDFQGPISSFPTPDGYTGAWVITGDSNYTLKNQDETSILEPKNNPDVIFEAESLGDYSFSWELTPTAKDDIGDDIVNSGCPPVVNPADLTLPECTTLDFDGIDDYVDLGTNYTGSSYSIEAWIRPEASTGTIISGPGFEIKMENLPSSLQTNGRWYHIAYTSGKKLYIDGILQSSNSISGVGGNNTLIGARWNSPTKEPENYYSGWIEEVRIWKTDLTQDQIRFMMNQHLQNAANIGVEIPMPVPGGLTYSNLEGYYRLISANPDPLVGSPISFDAALMPQNGQTPDLATSSIPGVLHNMTTHQQNTAPLPYLSANDGKWTAIDTWLRPDVWDIPNAKGIDNSTFIDWNIVRTFDNITSDEKDITVLGLKSETIDKTITMAEPLGPMNENNSGQMMRVTHYLLLDGNMDLVGESQLLQDEGSILEQSSKGWMQRDQQGKKLSYNYNYWSSPVSKQGYGTNNAPYSIEEVLRDPRDKNNPSAINYLYAYAAADGKMTSTSPLILSTYWMWKFKGSASLYEDWTWIGAGDPTLTGEGYTLKGTDGTVDVKAQQNYTFRGKPHNGDITLAFEVAYENYLVGNPYPSALDASRFIRDNLKGKDSIGPVSPANANFNGTLYFWSHFAGNSHYLQQYVGGYAVYNLSGGTEPASSVDQRINNNGQSGGQKPQDFIPVGQGFFVNKVISFNPVGTSEDPVQVTQKTGGNEVIFNNTQRIYEREFDKSGKGESVFHMQERKDKITANTAKSSDTRKKIWLKFNSPKGFQRQILVTADSTTTAGFDLGYDAPMIENNDEDIFWFFSNSAFVIQGIPDFGLERQLPLGFKIAKAGKLSIDIDELKNIPDDMNIYVADSLLNITHDLRKGAYKVQSDEGIFTDRLSIVFQDNTAVEPEPEEHEIEGDFKILYVNGTREIFIMNPHKIEIEKVYLNNMLGQQVHMYYDIPNKNLIKLPVSRFGSGVYVVKVYSENGITTKKVILE